MVSSISPEGINRTVPFGICFATEGYEGAVAAQRGFLFLLLLDQGCLTQVFVNGLMQMPDSAFLIAGENDLAGR